MTSTKPGLKCGFWKVRD